MMVLGCNFLSKVFTLLFIAGDHSVEVKLNNSHVEGSPFLVKAYNANKVKVTDINSGIVGKAVFFSSEYILDSKFSNIHSCTFFVNEKCRAKTLSHVSCFSKRQSSRCGKSGNYRRGEWEERAKLRSERRECEIQGQLQAPRSCCS